MLLSKLGVGLSILFDKKVLAIAILSNSLLHISLDLNYKVFLFLATNSFKLTNSTILKIFLSVIELSNNVIFSLNELSKIVIFFKHNKFLKIYLIILIYLLFII